MRLPGLGEKWTHFKGTVYRIVGFSWDASGEELVLCVLYVKNGSPADRISFSRPLFNFLELVGTAPRFHFSG